MGKSNKELLFERMHTVGGMPLNEDVNIDYINDDEIIDQILKRVPFLKEYNVWEDPNKLQAQKIEYYENVTLYNKNGEPHTFKQYNIASNFHYFVSDMGGNRKRYIFTLKNEFIMLKDNDMDEIRFRVFLAAQKMMNEKLSYSEDVIIDLDEEMGLRKDKFNEIINNINGKFFEVEEFANNINVPLFK